MNQSRILRVVAPLASCLLLMLGGAASAQTISVLGTNAPIPGPDDQYQTNFVKLAQSPPPGGGAFNYYVDADPAPGEIFTTGSNPNGYVLNHISLFDADGTGGGFGSSAQTFTLGIYSVSGTNATRLTTFVSQSILLPDFNWFRWTNLNLVLQPNTQYAYAMWRNGSGWMNLGNTNVNYGGGQVAVVPRAGGLMKFSSTSPWSASFLVGLTAITTPVVGLPAFSPYSITLPGTTATATAPVSGPGPYYYQWQADGGTGGALTNIPGATNASLNIDTTGFALGNYRYDLVVSNNTSAATGQVAVLTVQQPIGISGVIGIKFGFTNGYATSDALFPADNSGVATGQLVPPTFQPLTEVGRWNNLLANITNGADASTKAAAIDQVWTIDHDSADNALSGVTLTPSGFNDGWFSGGTGCAAGRLLYDCWKFNTGNGQQTGFGHSYASLTISGLPGSVYDVIVFINDNNGNYWGNAQANSVLAQNSPDIDNTSYGFNGASANPCGSTPALHTYSGFNGGNPANSVNYVRMAGVATIGGTIAISVVSFGGGDMGVSGIELVPVPAEDLKLVQDTAPNFADTVVGDAVVFSGAYSNDPPVSLQWLKISGGVTNPVASGATTITTNGVVTTMLTLNSLATTNSGVYEIKATSATNSAFYRFSSPGTLQVSNHAAPVNGIIVDHAAQAAPGSFSPPWTVDTSSNNLVYGFHIGGGDPGTLFPGLGSYALDGCIGDPSVLVDGTVSNAKASMVSCGQAGGAGQSVIFTLLTNSSPLGFEISQVQVYGGWSDAGRRDQQYEVLVAPVNDPTNFVSLISTYYLPDDPNGTAISTRTTLVPVSGVLAHNVAAVEINWNVTPQHLNGYAGYSEIAVLGTPSTSFTGVAPVISAASAAGGGLVISGAGGSANSGYTLLEATSLKAPVNWTTNSTGTLDGSGAFSQPISIDPSLPARFFRVRIP